MEAAMKSKGSEVHMEKTKVGKKSRHRILSGRWPCGCCGKGVGVSSILCIVFNKWCHLRCSGLKKVSRVQGFQCKKLKNIEEGDKELIATGGRIEEVMIPEC